MNVGRGLAIGDFVYEFDDIYVDYEQQVIREIYDKLISGNNIVAVRNAEYLANHCVTLRLFPEMTEDEVEMVIHACNTYEGKK